MFKRKPPPLIKARPREKERRQEKKKQSRREQENKCQKPRSQSNSRNLRTPSRPLISLYLSVLQKPYTHAGLTCASISSKENWSSRLALSIIASLPLISLSRALVCSFLLLPRLLVPGSDVFYDGERTGNNASERCRATMLGVAKRPYVSSPKTLFFFFVFFFV